MKDGAVEQCDAPDRIVLNPATDYVRKFTEDIDKARVVKAAALARKTATGSGAAVDGRQSLRALAPSLVKDTRDIIPVQKKGKVVGGMKRTDALEILLSN